MEIHERGKFMMEKSAKPMQLCPHCANSIAADTAKCPYCSAELQSDDAPGWLQRDEPSSTPRVGPNSRKYSAIPAKFIWLAAVLVVAVSAFFAGGYMQRSQLLQSAQDSLKQLQAKDQIIQSQEAQLVQTKQQLSENTNQIKAIQTKLEESQKDLSATQQRLVAAKRDVDRVHASAPVAVRTAAPRAPDPATSSPVPAAAARRTVEPGLYEITQATSVYENPSQGARVISQIGRGMRVNVVSSSGEWLEVQSKHGNPPGYVRADNARPIRRTS
jgi:hypothetical protein